MAKSVNFFTDIFYIFFGFFLTIFPHDYATTKHSGNSIKMRVSAATAYCNKAIYSHAAS